MTIKLYRENGEVLNISKADIEKHIPRSNMGSVENQRMRREGIKVIVDNNALLHHRKWNEHAARNIRKYFDVDIGLYGNVVIVSNDK